MKLESGTCNVCSAPCSSCMHLNRAPTEESSDENSHLGAANQYSLDEGDGSSRGSRSCERLKHAVSETSNMLSGHSSHDCLSENAESRRTLSNKYEDAKCLEGLDDYSSCISRASDANLVNGSHLRNADRINLACSLSSASHLGTEGSGSAPSVDMLGLSEILSSKGADTYSNSTKVQSLYGQSQSGKNPSNCPSLMDREKNSCSRIPEKLSEYTVENVDPSMSLTKERAPIIVSGEQSLAGNGSFINSSFSVSLKTYPKEETNIGDDVGDAKGRDHKSSVHEKVEEQVKLPGIPENQYKDESNESDVVEHDVKVCDICGDAGREDLLAICSRCSDGAEHLYCMREMLHKVPEGVWLCEECKYAEEIENKKLDVEEKKIHKVSSTSLVNGKRHSENVEISTSVKRQALESSFGSPKALSPKRSVLLSRESSSKSLDKGKEKVKSGNPMPVRNHPGCDDIEIAHSPSTGPRNQTAKGTLLKSSSFNNFYSKPRVNDIEEVVHQKLKGGGKHASARMISKSMSFKSSNLGHSNSTESKVKVLSSKYAIAPDLKGSRHARDSGASDRKFQSRIDWPVVSSTMAGSVFLTSKGVQKVTPCGDSEKPSGVNNRELKVNQDGKFSTISKSINNISCKSLETQFSSDRTSTSVNESLQDVLPPSRETANQIEKTKDSSSDLVRPGVAASSKRPFCKRCKDFGHPTECFTIGSTQESGAEISTSDTSSLEIHKSNRLKAAIQAALLKRRDIYKKKELPDQTDEFPTSSTDLNFGLTSQDQVVVSGTPKNSISAEEHTEWQESGAEISTSDTSSSEIHKENYEQQEILEKYTSGTSKYSSTFDLKEPRFCSADFGSQPGKSDFIGPVAERPVMTNLSNQALAVSSVISKMSAIPEYAYIWQYVALFDELIVFCSGVLFLYCHFCRQVCSIWASLFVCRGVFEVHRSQKPPDLYTGIQAHLSTCASPKVLEVVNKFLPEVPLKEVSRLSTWPSHFQQSGAKEDNIALYFFAKDIESYERHFKGLLDHIIRNDLVLKGNIDGVELLIFPSDQLPKNSQRWNMLFFLWGVFRGRRINHSDSERKVSIRSLKVKQYEKDFPTAVMTVSETRHSPKRIDEEPIACDKAVSALPPATSTDQHHIMKGTASEIREYRESKPPEAMGTSVGSRIVDTNSDISVKQGDSLSLGNPVVSQEIGAASNISKEISERMNYDEDQRRPKRKLIKDDLNVDMEATFQGDLTVKGVNCQLPDDQKVEHVDLSDRVMQASAVSCLKLHWNEVNGKSEDEENSSKKLKTGSGGINGCCSSGGRDSFNYSFASLSNDLGSSASVENEGCLEACDGKIICEDLQTTERTFFPIDTHNKGDSLYVLNSLSMKGPHEYVHQFQVGIPNLELALGGETKPPHKGMVPFFVGSGDQKNNQEKLPDSLAEEQEDDGVAASLSLSLSFPSSTKEPLNPVPVAELLPDGHHVNTPLLLFGGFTDK